MATTPSGGSPKLRDFSKRGNALPVPDLTEVQSQAYERFLQLGKSSDERDKSIGLESLLREIYPIDSYDGTMKLEYVNYTLEEPRYTPTSAANSASPTASPSASASALSAKASPNSPRSRSTSASSPS